MPRVSGARAEVCLRASIDVGAYVAALAWSPDSAAVAIADDAGTVTVLDARDGASKRVAAHADGALTLDWSTRDVLASGGRDGRIVIGGTGSDVGRGWVERVAWHPTGDLLAVAHRRLVSFWTSQGECLDVSTELPATVVCLQWHPKSSVCAAGSYGGVRLISAHDASSATPPAWKGSVLALAFSPDGQRLAHGNQDASIHYWDLRKHKELEMWGYDTKVRELAWSNDGRWLATGGGASITVWDTSGRKGPEGSRPLVLDRHEEPISALAFRPAPGTLLASAGRDGLVALWNVPDDDLPVAANMLGEAATTLAWSPDGHSVAAAGAGGAVTVLSVTT